MNGPLCEIEMALEKRNR